MCVQSCPRPIESQRRAHEEAPMDCDAAESVRRFSEAARAVVWAFQAPVRIEILLHLMETPSDVGTLAARLDLAVTHVSNHLRALLDAGLVTMSVQQRRHVYAAGLGVRIEVERSTELAVDGRTLPRLRAWLCIRAGVVSSSAAAGLGGGRDRRFPSGSEVSAALSAAPEFRVELPSGMARELAPGIIAGHMPELKSVGVPGRDAPGHPSNNGTGASREAVVRAAQSVSPPLRDWRGVEDGWVAPIGARVPPSAAQCAALGAD